MGGGHAPNDIVNRGYVLEKILVKSPASIANLGPGFDVLAIAIDGVYDRVLVEALDEPVIVVESDSAPSGKRNSAYAVAKHMLVKYCRSCGVRIRVWKGVPVSAGLGSSGATSAAVAYALNTMFGLGLSADKLLDFAVEGELLVSGARHYDNVAASLLGGLVIVGRHAGLSVIRLDPPNVWLGVAVIRSLRDGKTGVARSLLPKYVDLKRFVAQTSALALLLASVHLNDAVLFGKAVSRDFVVEPARKSMIPIYDELKAIAIKEGALGFNISGAGPSVFIVHKERGEAKRITMELVDHLASIGVKSEAFIVKPSSEGVSVVDSG